MSDDNEKNILAIDEEIFELRKLKAQVANSSLGPSGIEIIDDDTDGPAEENDIEVIRGRS